MSKNRKENLLLGVYKYLKSKDFENFLSVVEELKTPEKVVEEQTGDVYIPDLTATHNGALCLFDLLTEKLSEGKQDMFIQRWDVLNKHAQSIDGKYYIIISVDQFDQLMTLINKHNLENIGILQFGSN